MITQKEYLDYFELEKERMMKSGHFSSEPTFLFKYDPYFEEFVFDPDNWNGCDVLRRYLYKNDYEISKFEIKCYFINDSTYIFIFTPKSFYEISWYKSRGRTDYIRKDGDLITLDEYIEICNELNVKL